MELLERCEGAIWGLLCLWTPVTRCVSEVTPIPEQTTLLGSHSCFGAPKALWLERQPITISLGETAREGLNVEPKLLKKELALSEGRE